jgi:hypothetical protein
VEIDRLYTRFRSALRDPRLQEAFDTLIKVWSGGSAAMMVSSIPVPLDVMNLLATVHNKTELDRLGTELKKLPSQASLAKTELAG